MTPQKETPSAITAPEASPGGGLNAEVDVSPAGTNDKFAEIFANITDEERDPLHTGRKLSWTAYVLRCRFHEVEPCEFRYGEHLMLTHAEIDQLNAEVDMRRVVSSRDEFQNRFVIRDLGGKPRVGEVRDGQLYTQTFDDFKAAWNDLVEEVATPAGPKFVSAPEVWLKKHARRYRRAEFIPGRDAPPDIFNLWRGLPPGLKPGWQDFRRNIVGVKPLYDWAGNITGYTPYGELVPITDSALDQRDPPDWCAPMFCDHMYTNMCNGEDDQFYTLLAWMADALCNFSNCETAIVLQGGQGTGKSFWAERFLSFYLEPYVVTLSKPEDILGKFNSDLECKQVLFAEEAAFAKDPKIAAQLRAMVTAPKLTVEAKHVNRYQAKKHFRMIVASNEKQVIDAALDERRYLALQVDSGKNNKNKAHFRRMQEEWDSGGRRDMFRFLTGHYWRQQVADGGFQMMTLPETALLRDQKLGSLSPGDSFILGILEDGEVGAQRPTPCKPNAFLSNGHGDRPRGLYQVMRDRVPKLRGESDKALSGMLRDWGVERLRSNGQTGWVLPSLAELRRSFEQRYGAREWGDDRLIWVDDLTNFRSDDDGHPF